MKRSNLRKWCLEERAIELKNIGLWNTEIALKLSQECGFRISASTVSRFFNKRTVLHVDAVRASIKQKQEPDNQLLKTFQDFVSSCGYIREQKNNAGYDFIIKFPVYNNEESIEELKNLIKHERVLWND